MSKVCISIYVTPSHRIQCYKPITLCQLSSPTLEVFYYIAALELRVHVHVIQYYCIL